MNKKKILVFIDWYLPGYKAGGPIRSCANLIEHLKDEFDFSVITRNTDYCETTPYPGIKADEWNVLADNTKVFYCSGKNITGKIFKLQISRCQPDIIYINGIYSYKFSILPLLLSRSYKNIKTIVAARGMFDPGAINVKKTKKLVFLSAAKIAGLYNHVVFHATNEQEKKNIISALGKNIKIKIAPNLPKRSPKQEMPKRLKKSGMTKLVSIARIAPEKNIKYAIEVLSHVKGNVEFDLFGAIYDHNYWNECLALMEKLPRNITIKYCGSIANEAVADILKTCHFMFMPTQGENFGHSIFESFNMGCPVIISDKTPWRNLEEKKMGWDIALAEKEKFISTIEECVHMSQKDYDERSHNAFEFAEKISGDREIAEQSRKLFL